MRKLIFSMHMSLDGLAAGPNGEMDWIGLDDEMFRYANRMTEEADTALYGRVTYQMMEAYWPTAGDSPNASRHDKEHSAWYKQVEKVVISRTMSSEGLANTVVISDHIKEEIIKLKQKEGKNILIFGSPSIVSLLLDLNLVDEFWVFVNPILLNKGIPFFGKSDTSKLELVENKLFSTGITGLHYNVTA